MLYCVLHEDPREDIRDCLEGRLDRVHGWMDNYQDQKDNFEEVVQNSLDRFEGRIDTHCKTVEGNAEEGIVLSCAANEVHRIADRKGEGLVSTFAMDVRNHCIHHVDRNIQEEDHVEDSHHYPVDCSKGLCCRKRKRYFQLPQAIHEWVEVDCNTDLQCANAVVVAFSSHEVERPRLDDLRKEDNIRFQLAVGVIF